MPTRKATDLPTPWSFTLGLIRIGGVSPLQKAGKVSEASVGESGLVKHGIENESTWGVGGF